MKYPKPALEIDTGQPARETRHLHSQDIRLRAAGFTIHERPRAGPVLWVRARRIFTEAEAVATLPSLPLPLDPA